MWILLQAVDQSEKRDCCKHLTNQRSKRWATWLSSRNIAKFLLSLKFTAFNNTLLIACVYDYIRERRVYKVKFLIDIWQLFRRKTSEIKLTKFVFALALLLWWTGAMSTLLCTLFVQRYSLSTPQNPYTFCHLLP